jgi:hypothetical protein
MTSDQGRKWLIGSSLLITGAQMTFLLVAPAFGYPLIWPNNLEILQILTPVLLGYLGSASHFVFMTPPPQVAVNNEFLGMLIKGPIAIYVVAMIAAFGAFGFSNRAAATPGTGMSVENLSTAVAICLGILAATTGVIVSYLFVVDQKNMAITPKVD